MKFKFRLDVLMRQRKIEQDMAQRAYADAQKAVDDQMRIISNMYSAIDDARLKSEVTQKLGGTKASELVQIDEFIDGQKRKIEIARTTARTLMQVAEEKHEVLVERVREHKILERLKEKKKEEFRKARNKKIDKEIDDIGIMTFGQRSKI